MRAGGIALGAGLLVALAIGFALWNSRSGVDPVREGTAPHESAPGKSRAPALLDSARERADEGAGSKFPASDAVEPERRDAQADPMLLRAGPDARDWIARMFVPPGIDASAEERAAWDESGLADLIHGAGHPCEGLPTDRASADAIAQGVLEISANPLNQPAAFPDLQRSGVVLTGSKDLALLRRRCARRLGGQDPESIRTYVACYDGLPDQPGREPESIFLPVPPGTPGAISLREYLTRDIHERAERLMAGPRCGG